MGSVFGKHHPCPFQPGLTRISGHKTLYVLFEEIYHHPGEKARVRTHPIPPAPAGFPPRRRNFGHNSGPWRPAAEGSSRGAALSPASDEADDFPQGFAGFVPHCAAGRVADGDETGKSFFQRNVKQPAQPLPVIDAQDAEVPRAWSSAARRRVMTAAPRSPLANTGCPAFCE